METNGGDRSLELVGDGIDKTVVLLVLADFADQKAGIQDQTGDNRPEEDDPKQDLDALAPVDDDPAKTDSARYGGEQNSEGEEE